jgi:hypothetical protein
MCYQNPRALSGKRGEKDMSSINLFGDHKIDHINYFKTDPVSFNVHINTDGFEACYFFDSPEQAQKFADSLVEQIKPYMRSLPTISETSGSIPGIMTTKELAEEAPNATETDVKTTERRPASDNPAV